MWQIRNNDSYDKYRYQQFMLHIKATMQYVENKDNNG